MAQYFVGTAGWSYKDWEGIVYPVNKGQDFHPLVLLSKYINVVEINSTFYRPPSIRLSLSWVKRVEDHPDFSFSVKLHQVFTHKREGFSQSDADSFKRGLEPLMASKRLAAVLIQFPWSFAHTPHNLDYIISLFMLFSDYTLALEVRHGSWDSPSFYELLSEHRVVFCNIDQPLFGNSIKPSSVSTNPEFSYVRLHGRNYKNWFRENAGRDARYDYLYTTSELDEWVKRIKELGKKSGKVFVITNNHYRGQALANALQIQNLITAEKLDVPLDLLKQYPVLRDIIKKLKRGQLDLFEQEP